MKCGRPGEWMQPGVASVLLRAAAGGVVSSPRLIPDGVIMGYQAVAPNP
jgi:hypothetical protein